MDPFFTSHPTHDRHSLIQLNPKRHKQTENSDTTNNNGTTTTTTTTTSG